MADELMDGMGGEAVEACAHCGHEESQRQVVLCSGCHFVYCTDHADPDDHLCVVVRQECRELDADAA